MSPLARVAPKQTARTEAPGAGGDCFTSRRALEGWWGAGALEILVLRHVPRHRLRRDLDLDLLVRASVMADRHQVRVGGRRCDRRAHGPTEACQGKDYQEREKRPAA